MITSTSNIQVKELMRLMKKSRARAEAGVFLVEGPRMVEEIPEGRIQKIYVSESFASKHRTGQENDRYEQAEVLADLVFDRVSDTKTPQGVLAVVKRAEYEFRDLLGKKEGKMLPHILVLDNLQDPGNLGTIFRTAEAAGATGILLSSDCVDIYNPKVIRSTMGAVFRVPFYYTDDLVGTLEEMKREGITIYAAHLDGKNTYDKENYRNGCAFLIGNEGNGLREETARCADCKIRIPMEGKVESLNAAVAASVLMYEAARQRRQ